MDINFELYKVFYEVANSGSISKGARKLMISQPAVSQAVKTLESQLGGTLFIRTPKGVKLTNEGNELYNYIKEGMNYFTNGTNKFLSLKALETGTINIGSTTSISEYCLINYLKDFHKLYPNIKINITNDLTDNLINNLRNGNLDIIIISIPSTDNKDIEINHIAKLNDIFVGNEQYQNLNMISVEKLLSEKILLQKLPSITRTNFNNFLKYNKLQCTPFMETVSHELLIKLTENGFGIALLTKEFINDRLNKTLFEIKTNKSIPPRELGYAIKKNSIPTFAATEFIKILKNEYN